MSKLGRIKGNEITAPLRPAVSLVSTTSNPVGTLFSLWHGSRHEAVVSAEDAENIYRNGVSGMEDLAHYICECYPEYAGESGTDARSVIENVASLCLKANVPASESVLFTLQVDNANVGWREQLVRSKLASYWTQTSRTADLRTMDINMSDNIEFYGGQEAVDIYKDATDAIRTAYKKLVELGVPVEDIRLQPQQHVHRVYWMISARALLPIVSKRCSWVAQASLWSPIIADLNGILTSVSPIFSQFLGHNDDCKISNGEVTFYKYDNEIEDRYYQRDPQPVDPLWLAYRKVSMPEHTDLKFYDRMKSEYVKLWNEEICNLLGWDKNDPTKLGIYDRPKSYWDSLGIDTGLSNSL